MVPTCTLILRIPHIVKAQAKKAAKQATLTCPVSTSDQMKFTHAHSDPYHDIIQELKETLLVLTPAHTQALAFFNELQNKCQKHC
jgi:predicted glycosyltransferase